MVTVTGGKGGPGATTVSIGLASAWAALGDRTVLLADLDPAGGDVAAHLTAVDLRRGLLPLASLAGPELNAAQIAAECVQVTKGLWVLAGLPRPDVTGLVSSELLRKLLTGCRTLADMVVLDAGRLLPNAPALHLALEAEITVVAVRPHLPGALAARRALDILNGLPARGRLHLVAVAAPRSGRAVDELTHALHHPMTGAIPTDPRGIQRTLRAGRPPRRGRAARAYAAIAARLLEYDPDRPRSREGHGTPMRRPSPNGRDHAPPRWPDANGPHHRSDPGASPRGRTGSHS